MQSMFELRIINKLGNRPALRDILQLLNISQQFNQLLVLFCGHRIQPQASQLLRKQIDTWGGSIFGGRISSICERVIIPCNWFIAILMPAWIRFLRLPNFPKLGNLLE